MTATNSSRFIDEYVGDLLTGLDRIGRILFNMYWRWSEFKEDLGKTDLLELEDLLLNVFETLGSVILKLRQAGSPSVSEVPFSFSDEGV